MADEKQVDLIIFADRDAVALRRTLGSAAMQTKKEALRARVVCAGPEADACREMCGLFTPLLSVEVADASCATCWDAFEAELARDGAPFVAFLEAGDCFYHAYAVQQLLDLCRTPGAAVLAAPYFLSNRDAEGNVSLETVADNCDTLFAAFFARNYLQKAGLSFLKAPENADRGAAFAALAYLLAPRDDWRGVSDFALVRDESVHARQPLANYARAMQCVLGEADARLPGHPRTADWAARSMAELYYRYVLAQTRDEEEGRAARAVLSLFFRETFASWQTRMPMDFLLLHFNDVMCRLEAANIDMERVEDFFALLESLRAESETL